MLFNILYRAGERGVKCLPRSCTCLHYRGERHIIFDDYHQHRFLQFPFPLFSEKINNCPIYFKNM